MENQVRNTALTHGVIIGVVYAFITTLMYAFDLSLFTNFGLGLFLIVLVVGFSIFSVVRIKKMLSGVITFRQAFMSYIIPIIVCIAINSLLTGLLFNVIDIEAKEVITENSIEAAEKMMRAFGAKDSEIDPALDKIREQDNFAPVNLLKSFIYSVIFHSVFGLIIAAIFKTRRPV